MKKFLFVLALVAFIVSCGGGQRRTVKEASDTSSEYTLDGCGLKINIPAGWKIEVPLIPTGAELFVVKDQIDIIVDVMLTESNAEKVWSKIEGQAEKREAGYNMKLSRPMEKKKINGIDAVTFYGTAKAGADSIDVDAFNCPTGTSSVAFYTYSPVSTYKTDRPAVLALVNSVKLADGYSFAKSLPKKK
jgi:hypothetical protein